MNLIPNKNGMLRVWGIPEGRWLLVHPIDAREGIQLGTMALNAPKDAKESLQVPPLAEVMNMSAQQIKDLLDLHDKPLDLAAFEKLSDVRQAAAAALGAE